MSHVEADDVDRISISSSLYDNLPSHTNNLNMRVFMGKFSDIIQEHNPNLRAESYINESIAKLEAILAILNERKVNVRTYVSAREMK